MTAAHYPHAPASPRAAPDDVVSLRAGAVRIRHQPASPLQLAYAGDRPVLLYLLKAPRRALAGDCRLGTHSFVLLRGAPAELRHAGPLEVLAIAYDGAHDLGPPRTAACGASDVGLRVLAQEIRRALREESSADPAYLEALAEGMLARAAHLRGEPGDAPEVQPLTPAKLRRLTDYIDAHLGDPFRVVDLAAEVGLSRGHFTRAFHRAVGEAPHRFVLQRRLEAAKAGIEAGAEDLAAIAVRCGISSHAHMSTAFRQAFGLTPSAVRLAALQAGRLEADARDRGLAA